GRGYSRPGGAMNMPEIESLRLENEEPRRRLERVEAIHAPAPRPDAPEPAAEVDEVRAPSRRHLLRTLAAGAAARRRGRHALERRACCGCGDDHADGERQQLRSGH